MKVVSVSLALFLAVASLPASSSGAKVLRGELSDHGHEALEILGSKASFDALDMTNDFEANPENEDAGIWVVSGATGRTGQLAFEALESVQNVQTRALVRNATKAKSLLNCGNCTEADGIFIGDVTSRKTLSKALRGASGLVILTASFPLQDGKGHYYYPDGATPKDIDWRGTVNQILEAKAQGVKHIVLVSSMGTTVPDGMLDKIGDGHTLFYKLNAEAVLMQSGLYFTIIKPCGLTDQNLHLGTQVGHCDNFKHIPLAPVVSRTTIATYIKSAVDLGAPGRNVRFAVCSDPFRPFAKDDMAKLYRTAADISDC